MLDPFVRILYLYNWFMQDFALGDNKRCNIAYKSLWKIESQKYYNKSAEVFISSHALDYLNKNRVSRYEINLIAYMQHTSDTQDHPHSLIASLKTFLNFFNLKLF